MELYLCIAYLACIEIEVSNRGSTSLPLEVFPLLCRSRDEEQARILAKQMVNKRQSDLGITVVDPKGLDVSVFKWSDVQETLEWDTDSILNESVFIN